MRRGVDSVEIGWDTLLGVSAMADLGGIRKQREKLCHDFFLLQYLRKPSSFFACVFIVDGVWVVFPNDSPEF